MGPSDKKRKRWKFTNEFKRDAVELVRGTGRPIEQRRGLGRHGG